MRLIAAILMEQSDERAVQRARCKMLEPKARAAQPWLPSATILLSCSLLYARPAHPDAAMSGGKTLHHPAGNADAPPGFRPPQCTSASTWRNLSGLRIT